MGVPATYYANVEVSLSGGSAPQAGFGTCLFLNDHSGVDSAPILGPYSSADEAEDDGHLSGSPFHNFMVARDQQSPRVASVYSGLLDGDISDSLDAIENENPSAGYGVAIDSRVSADILELAAWIEARKKIAIVQSNDESITAGTGMSWQAVFGGTPADGTYRLTFTGFGLGSPVNVDVVRAGGNPASNALLGDALRTELTTAAGGSLSGELVTASIGGTGATVTFRTADGLTGTVTVTDPESPDGLAVTLVDADIASQLFLLQYTRTALFYHPTDAEMLDARVLARGLGYNLDAQQGAWSWRGLGGISGAPIGGTEATAIRAVNANYFATATTNGGNDTTAFTYPGRFPSGATALGRRIQVTTTIDWTAARLQEEFLNMFLKSSHGITFDKDGIAKADAATRNVLNVRGIAAKHFTPAVIPVGSDYAGEVTPFVKWPKPSELSAAVRASGLLTSTAAIVNIMPTMERIEFSITASE